MLADAPYNPRRNLELARTLANETSDEARLRAAVSRGYYGLFLIAREKTGIVEHRDIHRRVIATLSVGYPRLATRLGQMRYLRELADYQPLPSQVRDRDWIANWQSFSLWATEALSTLEALPERI